MIELSREEWYHEFRATRPIVPIVLDRLPEAIANFLSGRGPIEALGDDLSLIEREIPKIKLGGKILVVRYFDNKLWLETEGPAL